MHDHLDQTNFSGQILAKHLIRK